MILYQFNLYFYTNNTERYKIDKDGYNTWTNGGVFGGDVTILNSLGAELILNRSGSWGQGGAGIRLPTNTANTDYWTFGMLPNSTNNIYLTRNGTNYLTIDQYTGYNTWTNGGSFGGDVEVAGSIKIADDTTTASASNVGAIRYRTSGSNSYADMCMQTDSSTYEWVNIVQNNW